MKEIALLASIAAFVVTGNMPAVAEDLAAQIVGVWKYVSLTQTETASGKVMKPFGDKPSGYIICDWALASCRGAMPRR